MTLAFERQNRQWFPFTWRTRENRRVSGGWEEFTRVLAQARLHVSRKASYFNHSVPELGDQAQSPASLGITECLQKCRVLLS